MLLTALCRFVTWFAMTVLAALSLLTEAPMTPRCAEIAVTAALMAVSAVCEALALVKTFVFRLNWVAERVLMVVEIWVLAAVLAVLLSLIKTTLLLDAPATALKAPRLESVEVTLIPVAPVFVIEAWPAPLIVSAVPADSVPAVTALVIAVCSAAIVLPAAAVKTNVPPVAESLMVVFEPVCKTVVVARGVPALPCVEVKTAGALEAKTFCPLKLVVAPIWLTSDMID